MHSYEHRSEIRALATHQAERSMNASCAATVSVPICVAQSWKSGTSAAQQSALAECGLPPRLPR